MRSSFEVLQRQPRRHGSKIAAFKAEKTGELASSMSDPGLLRDKGYDVTHVVLCRPIWSGLHIAAIACLAELLDGKQLAAWQSYRTIQNIPTKPRSYPD
jgi:hypothetical protein